MRETTDRAAFFLDRDGVLIEERNYLHDPNCVVLLPTVDKALKRIEQAGYRVFVITNQAGVARGYFPLDAIHQVHKRIFELLAEQEIDLLEFYACPHHPDGVVSPWNQQCDCRKPSPGLISMAARDHGIALPKSFFIGDKLSDLQAGAAVGCKTALVRTGYGVKHESDVVEQSAELNLVTVADNLLQAVEACLCQLGEEKTTGIEVRSHSPRAVSNPFRTTLCTPGS